MWVRSCEHGAYVQQESRSYDSVCEVTRGVSRFGNVISVVVVDDVLREQLWTEVWCGQRTAPTQIKD